MTPDIPRLRKAVEFAEATAAAGLLDADDEPSYEDFSKSEHTEMWYQGLWSTTVLTTSEALARSGKIEPQELTVQDCGTAYCIAGFTISQEPGYHVELDAEVIGGNVYLRETLNGSRIENHKEIAEKLLGLTNSQAVELFSGGNSVEDVRRIAEEIAGEKL